ncbi:MAG TPA: VOC family protein [Baekduia sp.]
MTAIRGFHHVGIITDDLATIRRVFGAVLGAEVREPVAEPALGVEILWVDLGGVALEFLCPTSPESRAAEILRAGEGGVHHIALAVDDADVALAELRDAGLATFDRTARAGAGGARIGFVDPEHVAGTLVELVGPSAPGQTN